MASVNAVDYDKPSSTALINTEFEDTDNNGAPNGVQFREDTKDAIYKDFQFGNVKLNAVQESWINEHVNPDDVQYSDEEIKANGSSQIDTTKTGKANGWKNAGSAVASIAGGVAGVWFGPMAAAQIKEGVATTPISPWVGLANGVYALATAAAATLLARMFDDQFDNRTAQLEAAEQNNNTINGCKDALDFQRDAMAEESAAYGEACEKYTNESADRMSQIGALQAEKLLYESQGNTQKAAEIQAQIDKLLAGAEEPSAAEEDMETYKGNLEGYRANGIEAEGVKESGTIVSEFLQGGRSLRPLADINGLGLATAAIAGAVQTYSIFAGIKFAWDAVPAIAGAALFALATVQFGFAAKAMFEKAKKEGDCAVAGDTMNTNLTALEGAISDNTENVDACTAMYAASDAASTETLGGIQGGIDSANGQFEDNLEEGEEEEEPVV